MKRLISKKKSIYWKLVMIFLFIILIVTTFLIGIYAEGVSLVKKEVAKTMRTQNANVAKAIQEETNRIVILQYKIAELKNATIRSELAENTSEGERVEAILDIQEMLSSVLESSRFIEELYLIIPDSKFVILSNSIRQMDGRAMIACENSGHIIADDFPEVRKIVSAGATNKPVKDYELTRYACYLIVQNGDPRKEVIALGQTYFAIQTYRQEVADHFNELDEDRRRLVVRGDIKQWNQLLAETAHDAGVITNEEFAIFQNAGYMGLYGGLDVDDIHKRKGLEVGQKILDYMGSTELIANLFRISQTEEKLRKDEITGAKAATATHYKVGKEVRGAIEKIGGTMPEDLPTPEKSIQQVEKEQMARLKAKAKAGKLMLDE